MIVHGHTKWLLVNWLRARKKSQRLCISQLSTHVWPSAHEKGRFLYEQTYSRLTKESTIRTRQFLVRRARFVRGSLRSCSLFTPQTIWVFRLVSSNILELILTIRSFTVREFIFSCMLWINYSKCDIYRWCKASHFLHE